MTQGDQTDLTTRARIRNAALVEFARHGFKGATIRGIARTAGVSSGLVQHHFGTKEGLQRACDTYVLDTLRSSREEGLRNGEFSRPDYLANLFAEMGPLVDYMTMSVTSGSEIAARWFDDIVATMHDAFTSGELGSDLEQEDDPRAVAAVLAAMGLGLVVFFDSVRRALDDSESEAEFMVRLARARMLITSDRIVGEETRRQLTEGLDRFASTLDPPAATRDAPGPRE